MKKPKQKWRQRLAHGKCECVFEPQCEGGLEGYNLRDVYRFEQMQDDKGTYYRVYPNEDTGYYETCKPHLFKKCFKITQEEAVNEPRKNFV